MKKSHWINLLAGVALFSYLEFRLGFRESIETLGSAAPSALLLASAAFLAAHLVRIVKWRIYYHLAGWKPSAVRLCRFYFDLKLMGLITPGRLGEFVPAILADDGDRSRLVSFTTYDRLTEAFLTLLLALFAFTFVLRDFTDRRLLTGIVVLAALLLIAAILSIQNEWMMSGARGAGRRLERFRTLRPVARLLRSRTEIARGIRTLQQSLRELFQPRNAGIVMFVTIIAVGVDLFFWNQVFRALSFDVSLGVLIAVVTIFNMSGFLSPTPAGIGVADALFIIFLRSLGHDGAFGSLILLLRLLQFVLTALPWLLFRMKR